VVNTEASSENEVNQSRRCRAPIVSVDAARPSSWGGISPQWMWLQLRMSTKCRQSTRAGTGKLRANKGRIFYAQGALASTTRCRRHAIPAQHKQAGKHTNEGRFFYYFRVFIEEKPEQEESETLKSTDTQFAAFKLPKCLEAPHITCDTSTNSSRRRKLRLYIYVG